MANLFAFIFTFVFSFLSSLVHGWALAKLWGWFVVKTFPTLPVLTVLQAIGISLVVSVFFSSTHMALASIKNAVVGRDTDDFLEKMLKAIGNSFVSMTLSAMAVGIGWIWLQLM